MNEQPAVAFNEDEAEPAVGQIVTITLEDLVNRTNDALSKMSNGNPHKKLVYMLGSSLVALSEQFTALQNKVAALPGGLEALKGTPDAETPVLPNPQVDEALAAASPVPGGFDAL